MQALVKSHALLALIEAGEKRPPRTASSQCLNDFRLNIFSFRIGPVFSERNPSKNSLSFCSIHTAPGINLPISSPKPSELHVTSPSNCLCQSRPGPRRYADAIVLGLRNLGPLNPQTRCLGRGMQQES